MRVLQVGLGGFGRDWARAVVPTVPEVEPVGYVDSAPEALAALVEEGIADSAACYPSVEEGISATTPDAVLITASLPGHAPIKLNEPHPRRSALTAWRTTSQAASTRRGSVAQGGTDVFTVQLSREDCSMPWAETGMHRSR